MGAGSRVGCPSSGARGIGRASVAACTLRRWAEAASSAASGSWPAARAAWPSW